MGIPVSFDLVWCLCGGSIFKSHVYHAPPILRQDTQESRVFTDNSCTRAFEEMLSKQQ